MAPFYKLTSCSLIVLFIYVEYVVGATGKRCYDCNSGVNGVYNPQCPKYRTVDEEKVFKKQCEGHCFIRSDAKNENVIYRGCTDGHYGLPNPLPPDDGCYLHNSEVWCVCNSDLCNYKTISENVTAKLDAHNEGVTLGPGEEKKCYVCLNYDYQGNFYSHCPKNDSVNAEKTWNENCSGHCFSRTDSKYEKMIFRGCSDSQPGLPNPLPADGCYKYHQQVWCVCSTHLCNYGPIVSENITVSLDAHISHIPVDNGITLGPGEEKKCYVCLNYDYQGNFYSHCPKNDSVNTEKTWNENCAGHCFSRTDFKYEKMIFRGCSDSQPDLPNPLPADGCYNYLQQVWCVCSTHLCNYGPIVSENITVSLDAHISHIPVDNGITLGPGEEKKCHVCINYDLTGKYYPHCPKNDFVNPGLTWKANCTGLCFTRTDDIDDRLIYRGCTDQLWNFSDPPPPDGCYTYYLETWCICSTNLCNFGPIGIGEIELDAHITNGCECPVCPVCLYFVCLCIVQFLLTK